MGKSFRKSGDNSERAKYEKSGAKERRETRRVMEVSRVVEEDKRKDGDRKY